MLLQIFFYLIFFYTHFQVWVVYSGCIIPPSFTYYIGIHTITGQISIFFLNFSFIFLIVCSILLYLWVKNEEIINKIKPILSGLSILSSITTLISYFFIVLLQNWFKELGFLGFLFLLLLIPLEFPPAYLIYINLIKKSGNREKIFLTIIILLLTSVFLIVIGFALDLIPFELGLFFESWAPDFFLWLTSVFSIIIISIYEIIVIRRNFLLDHKLNIKL